MNSLESGTALLVLSQLSMLPESVYSLLEGNPNYLTQFVLHVHEIYRSLLTSIPH
jgi:hypothetical protein